jgi:hypothetical protein
VALTIAGEVSGLASNSRTIGLGRVIAAAGFLFSKLYFSLCDGRYQAGRRTEAEHILGFLQCREITHVVALCGHTNIAVLASLAESPIDFVTLRHELMASHGPTPMPGSKVARRWFCHFVADAPWSLAPTASEPISESLSQEKALGLVTV